MLYLTLICPPTACERELLQEFVFFEVGMANFLTKVSPNTTVIVYTDWDFQNPRSTWVSHTFIHWGCQKTRLLFKDIQQNHILYISLAEDFLSLRQKWFVQLFQYVGHYGQLIYFRGIRRPSQHLWHWSSEACGFVSERCFFLLM